MSRQPSRGRPWSWIAGRPRLIDGVIVVLNFIAGALGLIGSFDRRSVVAALLCLVLVEAVVLFWRRTQPLPVLLVILAGSMVASFLSPDRAQSSPALAFAVYAVSVYSSARVRLWTVIVSIALIVGGVGLLFLNDPDAARRVIPFGVTSVIAWMIGAYIRSRRQSMVDLVARHARERQEAAEAERLRIARELHDVVAHNVSVIAIQSGAARVSGGSSQEALQAIETTARDTLSELNSLLGVLRKQPDAPLAPQPGLDQVDALLKSARDAGLEATLKVTGDKRPLPAALDLSAYRIVQEAITNVLKHAGASRLEVVADYQPGALVVTVSDNGGGASEQAVTSTGHGLIGMRERIQLFGGDLSTGSSPLGGFTVRATLPVKT